MPLACDRHRANDGNPSGAIPALGGCTLEGHIMAKGNNSQRGNKEVKKPKAAKPKVLATANSLAGKPAVLIAGKKVG
ncbi:MAG: hypothetical protein L0G27_02070 [Paracoccus sp. (in: a-proteobacteria)]|nr:hypothetical protein [Paracoccus sp. (in: a-proteobacteria)]